MAQAQAKTGVADDKWEARVKEYETRLRIAGEKIKTEKQGGRERAVQLEGQIRYAISITILVIRTLGSGGQAGTETEGQMKRETELIYRELQKQIEASKGRNTRVEGVVASAAQVKANAAHLLPRSGSTGSSRDREREER